MTRLEMLLRQAEHGPAEGLQRTIDALAELGLAKRLPERRYELTLDGREVLDLQRLRPARAQLLASGLDVGDVCRACQPRPQLQITVEPVSHSPLCNGGTIDPECPACLDAKARGTRFPRPAGVCRECPHWPEEIVTQIMRNHCEEPCKCTRS